MSFFEQWANQQTAPNTESGLIQTIDTINSELEATANEQQENKYQNADFFAGILPESLRIIHDVLPDAWTKESDVYKAFKARFKSNLENGIPEKQPKEVEMQEMKPKPTEMVFDEDEPKEDFETLTRSAISRPLEDTTMLPKNPDVVEEYKPAEVPKVVEPVEVKPVEPVEVKPIEPVEVKPVDIPKVTEITQDDVNELWGNTVKLSDIQPTINKLPKVVELPKAVELPKVAPPVELPKTDSIQISADPFETTGATLDGQYSRFTTAASRRMPLEPTTILNYEEPSIFKTFGEKITNIFNPSENIPSAFDYNEPSLTNVNPFDISTASGRWKGTDINPLEEARTVKQVATEPVEILNDGIFNTLKSKASGFMDSIKEKFKSQDSTITHDVEYENTDGYLRDPINRRSIYSSAGLNELEAPKIATIPTVEPPKIPIVPIVNDTRAVDGVATVSETIRPAVQTASTSEVAQTVREALLKPSTADAITSEAAEASTIGSRLLKYAPDAGEIAAGAGLSIAGALSSNRAVQGGTTIANGILSGARPTYDALTNVKNAVQGINEAKESVSIVDAGMDAAEVTGFTAAEAASSAIPIVGDAVALGMGLYSLITGIEDFTHAQHNNFKPIVENLPSFMQQYK